MSWRPRDLKPLTDSRFDRYRERAGRLFDDDGEAGVVFVRLVPCAAQIGGALWWRQWSEPFEQVHEYVLFGGQRFTDAVTDADDFAGELVGWGAGRFMFAGDVFEVDWLDAAGSARVRDAEFGLDPLS